MTTFSDSYGGAGEFLLEMFIGTLAVVAFGFILAQIFGQTYTDRQVEKIPYESTTVYSDELTQGVTCYKPKGEEGIRVKTYEHEKHFGIQTRYELVEEKVTVQPQNETKVVGTRHKYSGYCEVDGTYRRRYASCYGDYDPASREAAERQAYICNNSPYNESGCYSTYYSPFKYQDCSRIKP